MNLSKILKGCRIAYDGIQSIKGLTLIPLVCDKEMSFDDKYASPFAYDVTTQNYGDLTVHKDPKEGSKTLLILGQTGFITNHQAQDHMISKAALTKQSVRLTDSRCVQHRQPGYMTSQMQKFVVIAPMKIREVAYNYVGQPGYDKLWATISEFNSTTGSGREANIKDYFNKWGKELDQFIAHFERVPKCIGFLTLYNDEVVAIDKFPSFTYTEQIWERLVRDSYAALVIKDQLSKTATKSDLKTVKDYGDGVSLEEMYQRMTTSRNDHYRTLLEEMMDVEFTTTVDPDTAGSSILKSDGYVGQVIDDSGINVMVSIIKKESFNPEKMRDARKMRSLAKNQKDFKL